jgi:electron transfer flavoprotein beta subunit
MMPMLVVAAQRWTDARPRVDPLTGEVRTYARAGGAGEADQCALEHALRLAAKLGGRCAAVTVGPPAAEEMLRQALAVGADEVLRIGPPAADPALEDGAETARVLADGLTARYGRVDLVLCGDQSVDRGTGSTPAYLAGRLGAAQALGLLDVDVDVDGGGLRALRRLDGGRRESLAVPLPAVCSVEPAAVRLRRAALPATLAARRTEIPHILVDAGTGGTVRVKAVRAYRPRARVLPAPTGGDARLRMLELTGALVERVPPRVVTPSSPAEAAEELLGFLREHGYLGEERDD